MEKGKWLASNVEYDLLIQIQKFLCVEKSVSEIAFDFLNAHHIHLVYASDEVQHEAGEPHYNDLISLRKPPQLISSRGACVLGRQLCASLIELHEYEVSSNPLVLLGIVSALCFSGCPTKPQKMRFYEQPHDVECGGA